MLQIVTLCGDYEYQVAQFDRGCHMI